MAITTSTVACSGTAAALNTQGGAQTLYIQNGATALTIGPAGVASGTGFLIAISGALTVNILPGDVLFGITAGGASSVQVTRVGA